MAYSKEIKEEARKRFERGETIENIAKVKQMPAARTIKSWVDSEGWQVNLAMAATANAPVLKHNDYQKRTYTHPVEMQEAVDKYFDSLYKQVTREVTITEDGNTRVVLAKVYDEDGEPVMYLATKPTLVGLRLFLKIASESGFDKYRHGLNDHICPEGYPTFSEILKVANDMIEEFNNQMLYDPKTFKGAEWTLNVRNNLVKKTKVEEISAGGKKLEEFF